MRRADTLDLIAADFADSVAAFDFQRAEGWLSTAFFSAALTGLSLACPHGRLELCSQCSLPRSDER